MTQPSDRLSQANAADAIRLAVELEAKRIESLDAGSIEQIAGGTTTGPGTTMGFFPPDS